MLYHLLRATFRVAMRGFFSRIEVEGLEHVPAGGPVLLVPNHTNGLLDGLAVACCLQRPVTLTAKSTLAKIPGLGWLMRAMNVVPFHRREDGGQGADPAANLKSLAEVRSRLAGGGAVCLFPEGKSHSDPGIRRFRTGAARIALAYLEQNADRGGLLIVPVGLYFEHKDRFRSKAWIGFGEPLRVADWRRNHAGANARTLTDHLEDRVRELSLSFDERSRSELFTRAADVLATAGEPPPELGLRPRPRLAEQVRWVHALQKGHARLRETEPARLDALARRVAAYGAALTRLGVAPHEVYLKMGFGRAAFFALRELELVAFGLPIALWGLANHLLPLLLVRWVARKMSREQDEFASNVVFLGVPVFTVFYLLQTVLAAVLLSRGWLLLYVIALPYSGVYALVWFDRVRGTLRRSRTYLRWRFARDLQSRLAAEGREIIAEIRRLGALLEEDHGTHP
jgi:glycerol-3-phosphate O-acyltransferase/dihydroxyacetone phosphate acyltransferase